MYTYYALTFNFTIRNDIKYCWLVWQVKFLLDQLQHISSELKDENEILIIEKYAYNAKRLTISVSCKTAIY